MLLSEKTKGFSRRWRIEIGSISRRRGAAESGDGEQRSFSLGSFEYIVEDGFAISMGSTTHRRGISDCTSVENESPVGIPVTDVPRDALAEEIAGGGRNWLREYVDRMAEGVRWLLVARFKCDCVVKEDRCILKCELLFGSCISQVWDHGPTLHPCKCPLCRREITLLVPSEASSRQYHMIMQDLPFLLRRLLRDIRDPQRTLPLFIRARVYLAVKFSYPLLLMLQKESSLIHSNANLGVHGQGLLNLSGSGDCIEAQHQC